MNNLAIFGPFLDLQKFFKYRGLSFEISDSDCRDLLDELLRMVKFFFEKKMKIVGLVSKPHIFHRNL